MSIFVGGTSSFQRREGGSFYIVLQKLAIGNKAVEIGTSGFETGTSEI
jgi:hypothetical protein